MARIPEQPSRTSPPGPAVRTSPLAVVSLVLALMPCCPLVNVVGIVLGLAALRRIDLAGGRVGGRRMARAAVLAGGGMTILSMFMLRDFSRTMHQSYEAAMNGQVEAFVHAAVSGDVSAANQAWSNQPGERLQPDEIEAFGRELNSRYGPLKRFTIASSVTSGSLLTPRMDAAGIFVFENGQLTGSARFNLVAGTVSVKPTFRIRSLRIDDAQQGDLMLPPASDMSQMPN